MYPAGNLFLPAAHGRLESILKAPREGSGPAVALVLHPHPLGGGTMHNKVVFRAASALNDAGLTTLRLNFRGVGQSTGVHDDGRGELDDVRAGIGYLAENYPGQDITVCGFSFGAWVGLQIGVSDERVKNLISIGTPLSEYDFTFVEACRKAILFVHGELDEFGDVQRLRMLVERLKKHTTVQLKVIPEAGHFFEDHLDELKRAIIDWVNYKK